MDFWANSGHFVCDSTRVGDSMSTMAEENQIDEMPLHWETGCSNAKRWVSCPGSKYAHDDENELPARVGTLGHKIVEATKRGRRSGGDATSPC